MGAFRIALIYALLGIAWIIASDLYLYGADPKLMGSWSKGILFVLTTSAVIHLLTARLQGRLEAQAQAARRSEMQFRRVVEASPIGTFVQCGDWFRYLNPAAVKEFGAVNAGEMIGRSVFDIVHPDYIATVQNRIRDLIDLGKPTPAEFMQFLTTDGRSFEVQVSAVRIVYEGQQAALVFFENVTERHNRERWFQLLADAIPAIVAVSDPLGEVTYLNARWREFTGRSEAEVGLAHVFAAIHPDDLPRFRECWLNAVEHGTGFDCAARFRRADGTYRWHGARALPLHDSGGDIVRWVGIAVDVDDPMRVKMRTEQALEDERARIARDLHDDLGQLLAVTKMCLEAAPPSPDLARAAEAMGAAMVRTRDMAVLLRPPVIDRLGLFGALQWQADEFRRGTGIRCDVYVPDGTEPRLPPERRIAAFRIVQEALNNVSKHSRATEVAIEADCENHVLSIAVRDNGIGFDPSRAIDPDRLGIAGMRERAMLAGGVVEMESGKGRGTVVRLLMHVECETGQSRSFTA